MNNETPQTPPATEPAPTAKRKRKPAAPRQERKPRAALGMLALYAANPAADNVRIPIPMPDGTRTAAEAIRRLTAPDMLDGVYTVCRIVARVTKATKQTQTVTIAPLARDVPPPVVQG